MSSQFTDLSVTRKKFALQAQSFLKRAADYRKEGIICVSLEFPVFEFVFLAKASSFTVPINLQHPNGQFESGQINIHREIPFYLFSIRLDYSNFDTQPPSLRFIEPFTSQLTKALGTVPIITPGQQNKNSIIDKKFETQNQSLLIDDPEGKLFICLRGLREYHEHPQHNGDSWYLYRLKGKGDVLTILDQLQVYAVANYNALVEQQKSMFPHA
jgi:hypothetical protein